MQHQYKQLESKYDKLSIKAQQNEEVQKKIASKMEDSPRHSSEVRSATRGAKPFADGMEGDEDLGMDINMKGEHYHIGQKGQKSHHNMGNSLVEMRNDNQGPGCMPILMDG